MARQFKFSRVLYVMGLVGILGSTNVYSFNLFGHSPKGTSKQASEVNYACQAIFSKLQGTSDGTNLVNTARSIGKQKQNLQNCVSNAINSYNNGNPDGYFYANYTNPGNQMTLDGRSGPIGGGLFYCGFKISKTTVSLASNSYGCSGQYCLAAKYTVHSAFFIKFHTTGGFGGFGSSNWKLDKTIPISTIRSYTYLDGGCNTISTSGGNTTYYLTPF
jgi:hypothetical protein